MGLDVESESDALAMLPNHQAYAASIAAGNEQGVSFSLVKTIVQSGAVEQVQRGRYMAAVSLREAETLRGIIHMFPNNAIVEGAGAALALRINPHSGSGVPALLDASYRYEPARPFQASTARQCFRFLDSDSYYQERELNALLRAVQGNSCVEREAFFLDVRSCRRRQQTSTATTPISKLFTTPDQYHLLQYRATCMRIRELLRARNVFAMDAFRAFDTDRNGLIGCTELYSGLEWLGLHLAPSQVQDVVREMDKTHKGFVAFHEFRNALGISEGEEEKEQQSRSQGGDNNLPTTGQLLDLGGGGGAGADDDPFGFGLDSAVRGRRSSTGVSMFERIEIETKTIQEIHQLEGSGESSGGGGGATPGKSMVQVLKDVKFVTRKMASFQRIWNTKRTNARCDGECLWGSCL